MTSCLVFFGQPKDGCLRVIIFDVSGGESVLTGSDPEINLGLVISIEAARIHDPQFWIRDGEIQCLLPIVGRCNLLTKTSEVIERISTYPLEHETSSVGRDPEQVTRLICNPNNGDSLKEDKVHEVPAPANLAIQSTVWLRVVSNGL